VILLTARPTTEEQGTGDILQRDSDTSDGQ
jgi:hypothetical protein